MLAMIATLVLAPLLYVPGYLLAHAALGRAQPLDALERQYERVVVGALLNGWLALTLAELGIFSAWLHVLLLLVICAGAALVARRRGALDWPQATLGIVAGNRARTGWISRAWLLEHWQACSFAAVGVLFALLVARPFEVILGARDAGVYANTGFAIARTGGIVQHDALIQALGSDKQSSDPTVRDAAAQAETNMLGIQDGSRFIATRLRLSGFLIWAGDLSAGRVVPQFLHLYPAWIGLLASLLGQRGGLLATGLLGLLGVWSVGMLGRRLAGHWVGLLGMLFLALNGVQVWFSRYSTSEACAQFLCFAALYGFVGVRGQGSGAGGQGSEEAHSRETQNSKLKTQNSQLAGLIAGVAAGQLALTRIDSFVIVLPLLLFLAYMALTKRWSAALSALAGGLALMLLQTVLHIIFISRAYVLDTLYARLQDQSAILANLVYPLWTPGLQQQFMTIPRSLPLRQPLRLPIELGVLAVLLIAFVLLRRDGRPQRLVEHLLTRYRRALLNLGAIAILLLGSYAYFVRPQILTPQTLAAAPSCLAPAQLRAPTADCLALQGYIGAPIAVPEHPNQVAYALASLPKFVRGKRVAALSETAFSPGNPGESEKIGIAQANLVRLGWYLSPLGIVLGVAGFALWWRRGMNSASWLFFAASLVSAFFFLRLTYGTSDLTYVYILRRYVPVVYPAFSLGMAYALVALGRWTTNDRRPTTDQIPSMAKGFRLPSSVFRLLSIGMTLALLGFFVITNRPLYAHTEYAGALAQLSALVKQYGFGENDILLFRGEGRDTPDLVVTPLKYAFGIDALAVRSADPGKYAKYLSNYVKHWRAQGRQVYLVLGPNGVLELPGLQATKVGPFALHLAEFQQLRDQKPRGVQNFAFDFAVYKLADASAAAAPPATIAVDDYAAQVRGFYHPEQINRAAIAWTDGNGQLRLPWPRDNAPHTLTVKLSPGPSRPAALGPARVCLSYRPETTFAFAALPFVGEQCMNLDTPQMAGYRFTLDPRGQPAPATGTFLLRISSAPWVPAQADPAQFDQRSLGVQFGGIELR